MAKGGYIILDLTKIKNWTLDGSTSTGTQNGLFEKLTNTDKPVIIHGLFTVPDERYSEYLNDFFISTITKTNEEIAITFDYDITISPQDVITIS